MPPFWLLVPALRCLCLCVRDAHVYVCDPRAQLAWAVTIHKSQGLTLDRVVVDAGDDEKSMGLFFVAITRVRHPSRVAFEPVPSLERISDNIARKQSLRDRKEHEDWLRSMQATTARRYLHLDPPQPALHPPPRAVAKPKRSSQQRQLPFGGAAGPPSGSGSQQAPATGGTSGAHGCTTSLASTSGGRPGTGGSAGTGSSAEAERALRAATLAHNHAVLASLGLHGWRQQTVLPLWLSDALPRCFLIPRTGPLSISRHHWLLAAGCSSAQADPASLTAVCCAQPPLARACGRLLGAWQ